MLLKSIIAPPALGLAILAGGAAGAAPINLAALGLEAGPGAFATEIATTSLFAGAAFSSDTFVAPAAYNIAVSGSSPFGGADFAVSAFPVAGPGFGSLTGSSTNVGWDTGLVQVLLTISTNTGAFGTVSSRILAEISGSFGADPLGLGGGTATLGTFVTSSMTLTNVNEIPLPAALQIMALALGGVAILGRRSE